ncbi:MAG: hypothetical protein HC859_02130 [Bacteroidia bacterium]|nr:hypothetical protein [Bacteroidia bacterium]
MPVEVKELIIRTVINATDEKSTAAASENPQASKNSVAEAVEKLMEVIRKKNER